MAIINPTINLVARPGMSLPKPWVLSRDGGSLTAAQLAKMPTATDSEKRVLASSGTYITATTTLGIETEPNKLRHDYSSKKDSQYAGTYNGFLVEAFSENLLMTQTPAIPCRNLTGWAPSPTGAVTTASGAGITAPGDSTDSNTASKLAATNSTPVSVSKQITGLKANTTYTLSAYFKKFEKNSVAVPKIAFGAGTAATVITGLTPNRVITDPYNWILVTYKFTTSTSVTSSTNYHIGIKASEAPVYVDRVQLEEGNNTSTILESSKIRAAENLYYTGDPDTAKLIDPFEGTVYVMCKVQENVENIPGLKVGICQLGNDTGRRIVIRAESTSSSNWKIYGTLINLPIADATAAADSASAVFSIANADWPEDDWLKIAVRYRAGESNTIRMSVNGNQVVYGDLAADSTLKETFEASGITRPTGLTNEVQAPIRLGKVFAANGSPKTYYTLDGSIMHFAYFPKALSDEDLVALTS